MSLLDDVSIVVTPNGYKAGELYAVVPVPTEGTELVTNGDFATDSDWTKGTGWTISGGTATCDGTQTGNSNLYQAPFYVAGKRYKTKLTINSISGTLKVFTGTAVQVLTITSAGDYEVIALSSSTTLYLQSTASTTVDIDNVSVKEYTAADMDVTRATAATRVDEAGLVNYAEIIGSEEVTNGDFATDLSGWTTNGVGATFSPLLFTNTANNGQIRQDFTTVVGVVYKLSIEITSGSWSVYASTSTSSGGSLGNITATGELIFTATTTTTYILCYLLGASGTEGVIDNISVKEVTRDNVPRIDYTGGGCPHILAEPQRTNLLTYSEDFTDSSWATFECTVGSTSNIQPNGVNEGYSLTYTADIGVARTFESVVSGSSYTFSAYIKSSQNGTIKMARSNQPADGQYINVTTDWKRFDVQITPTSTTDGGGFYRLLASDLSSIEVYGAQLEEGSFPTSYIPTSGSTVTRNQDIFTRDGIGSLIGQTEGSIYFEFKQNQLQSYTQRILTLYSDSANLIEIQLTSSNELVFVSVKTGESAVVITKSSAITLGSVTKISAGYKAGDFVFYVNGVQAGTDTDSSKTIPQMDNLLFSRYNSTAPFLGSILNVQLYKTRLTNTQLAALTS